MYSNAFLFCHRRNAAAAAAAFTTSTTTAATTAVAVPPAALPSTRPWRSEQRPITVSVASKH